MCGALARVCARPPCLGFAVINALTYLLCAPCLLLYPAVINDDLAQQHQLEVEKEQYGHL
jgi:hypothetical protein